MLIRSSIGGTFFLLLQIGIAGALLGLSFSCFAQTQNVTYTVEINGAGKLSSLLREHLDISRRQNAVLSADELERLVAITPQQARELLATESYFSAVVQPVLDRGVDPWVVHIDIALGPETRVDALNIHFSGGIVSGPNADQRRMNQLRRRWRLKQGEVFRQTAWNEAKSELLKGLLVRDFPAATITRSEARIDPQKSSATLTVEVNSGPAFTFGELNIQGLERYSRTMIDSQNPIHPGDPYSQEKLNELQSRLEDSGYFRSAFAMVDIDPTQPERVPVRLDLVENPRKRLGLGGGFSTDTGARAQVKWLDRNFLQRNWRLESELRIDREMRVLGGDVFLQPIAIGWLPSFGAHLERTESGGEINDKIRTGARLVSPNKVDEKAWAIAFLADRQRIGDSFSNNRQALIGSFTYTKRRLNNPLRPRRGYVASLELGVGPRGLINESHIGRVVGRALWMHTFSPRWRTVARGQIGQVFGGSRQTVPADLLFRTGGDQSVRGYGYDSLGVEQNGAVVAGKVSAVLSAELIYQITPQWGAALFTDTGNAADAWSDFVFKHGSGVGARWNSPIGPVNLDLAYGHATREPRLHFSIGYGF